MYNMMFCPKQEQPEGTTGGIFPGRTPHVSANRVSSQHSRNYPAGTSQAPEYFRPVQCVLYVFCSSVYYPKWEEKYVLFHASVVS